MHTYMYMLKKRQKMSCSICLEDLDDDQITTLSCGHSFHVLCIIRWFRNPTRSSCPLCRDDGNADQWTFCDRDARIRLLRSFARRRDANPRLKKVVSKLRVSETRTREARRRFREFCAANKTVLDRYNALQRDVWQKEEREYDRRMELSVYEDATTKIPAIFFAGTLAEEEGEESAETEAITA